MSYCGLQNRREIMIAIEELRKLIQNGYVVVSFMTLADPTGHILTIEEIKEKLSQLK